MRRLLAALAAVVLGLAAAAPAAAAARTERVVFAGGCFWGVQAVFERVRGVTGTTAGFSGGSAADAHYEMVSTGTTGHAESVDVEYDPSRVSFTQLLAIFFTVAHDPTEKDRQGPDVGTQYRSAIFYTTAAQRDAARAAIAQLTARHAFPAPIVTEVVPLRAFYAAEGYHQHYYDHHPGEPYLVINDVPKVRALRERFPALARG